jgi:hypothetical protein
MIIKRWPFFSIMLLCLGFLAMLGSCNKSDRDDDIETLSARDYALAHHIFDDAFRQVHRFAMGDTLLNDTSVKQSLDACLDRRTTSLSDTVAVFPLVLNLNYGDQGTPCYDNGLRYGRITASFSGKYLNKGTIITFSFDGYRKDIYDVSGKLTVVNQGLNNEGRRYYTFIIQEGLITGTNINIQLGGTFSYQWVSGSSTETDFTDDVFEIDSGMVAGRNSRGSSFTNEVTSKYTSDLTCPHFVSGRSYMQVQNLIDRTLNYGVITECDNILISRRNNTYLEVEIPIMQPEAF